MRASVELGLAQLLTEPTPPGSVAICPADSPGLDSSWLRPLIARASEEPTRLLLPVVNGKRGHPVILPWSIALEIPKLPSGTGINRLVAEHTYAGDVLELEISAPGAIRDLDTPEDYASWIASE
jgi:molybdenum cofactor cytidylyltransferase